MLTRLQQGNKVVGTRRLTKAVEAGLVREAYVADDADIFIKRQVGDVCRAKGVPVVTAPSMKALGEASGIEVPAAAAGLLK